MAIFDHLFFHIKVLESACQIPHIRAYVFTCTYMYVYTSNQPKKTSLTNKNDLNPHILSYSLKLH